MANFVKIFLIRSEAIQLTLVVLALYSGSMHENYIREQFVSPSFDNLLVLFHKLRNVPLLRRLDRSQSAADNGKSIPKSLTSTVSTAIHTGLIVQWMTA
jgi:hypothetical protein